jgi:hypothetical protein
VTKVELSTEIEQVIERIVVKKMKTMALDICEQAANKYFNEFLGNKINIEIEKCLTSTLENQINLVLKEHDLVSKTDSELTTQSVKKFLDHIDHDYDLIVGEPTNTVYDEYYDFCDENKLPKLDKQWFSRELKRQTGIYSRVTTVGGKSMRLYTKGDDNE